MVCGGRDGRRLKSGCVWGASGGSVACGEGGELELRRNFGIPKMQMRGEPTADICKVSHRNAML